MKSTMDEFNIKTQQLLSRTMSFILTPLIDEEFKRYYQQVVTDLNKQEVTTYLPIQMKFVHVLKAIQRAYSKDDQECRICKY